MATFVRVYSFYLFEGSFHQGGGGWEHFDLGTDRDAMRRAAVGYLRRHWAGGLEDTCTIASVQRGEIGARVHLYPFVQVKVPGLTRVSFDPGGERLGGEPEPGGPYEGVDRDDLEGAVIEIEETEDGLSDDQVMLTFGHNVTL